MNRLLAKKFLAHVEPKPVSRVSLCDARARARTRRRADAPTSSLRARAEEFSTHRFIRAGASRDAPLEDDESTITRR